jgi:hypothetical protein
MAILLVRDVDGILGTHTCWERVTAQYPRLFAHWAWVPYSWWTG